MKYFKTIILVLFLTMFFFNSCKDQSVEIPQNTNQSIAAKSAMKALKSHFNDDGSLNRDGNNPTNNIIFDFCFDFVYPITLSYNTGTEVTVQDLNGLIAILVNMNDDLYVNGIAFPFQVEIFNHDTGGFEVVTVENEIAFMSIIDDCSIDDSGEQTDDCNCTEDYQPVCVSVQDPSGTAFTMEFPNFCFAECEGFTQNDVVDCANSNPSTGNISDDCFNFVYPISVIYYDGTSSEGTTASVNSDDELEMIFYANYHVEFVYPFTVQTEDNGQTVTETIASDDDFYTLIDNCNTQDCNCPAEYDPVCVATPNGGGTIQYDNECLAACDGFTPNDFVDCSSNDTCEITEVTVEVGDCISETAYTIILDFSVQNANSDTFNVGFSDGTTVSNLSINDLPISLDVDTNPSEMDSLIVYMQDNPNCLQDINWTVPDCATNTNCWSFIYPLTININGNDEVVNSDTEFDDAYNPSTSSLVYPFDVTINGTPITINTSNDFYQIGEFRNRCD